MVRGKAGSVRSDQVTVLQAAHLARNGAADRLVRLEMRSDVGLRHGRLLHRCLQFGAREAEKVDRVRRRRHAATGHHLVDKVGPALDLLSTGAAYGIHAVDQPS